jgi:hypothetical protein
LKKFDLFIMDLVPILCGHSDGLSKWYCISGHPQLRSSTRLSL